MSRAPAGLWPGPGTIEAHPTPRGGAERGSARAWALNNQNPRLERSTLALCFIPTSFERNDNTH